MTKNEMFNNDYNFCFIGYSDTDFDNYIDKSNYVNGKPIYFLRNISDQIFDSSVSVGMFICAECENITIQDLVLKNNFPGIYLLFQISSK